MINSFLLNIKSLYLFVAAKLSVLLFGKEESKALVVEVEDSVQVQEEIVGEDLTEHGEDYLYFPPDFYEPEKDVVTVDTTTIPVFLVETTTTAAPVASAVSAKIRAPKVTNKKESVKEAPVPQKVEKAKRRYGKRKK